MQIAVVLPANDTTCRGAARQCVRWLGKHLSSDGFSVLTSASGTPEGPRDELVWDGIVFGRWRDEEGKLHHDRSVMVLLDFEPGSAANIQRTVRMFLSRFIKEYRGVDWPQQSLYVATQGSRHVDFVTVDSASSWTLRG